MATRRKRPAKKAAPKRSNSNIQSAQRAATQRRVEQDQAKRDRGEAKPRLTAGNPELHTIDPRTGLPVPAPTGQNVPGDPVGRGANLAAQGNKGSNNSGAPTFKGGAEAASKIAGLASGIMQQHQEAQKPLADPNLYGDPKKNRQARLDQIQRARQAMRVQGLVKTKSAVYMGPGHLTMRSTGPKRQDEDGKTTYQQAAGDEIVTTDELMSWLTDETNFNKIKAAANKAGIDVQSYDDVAKLWEDTVKKAAAAYSTTGKKVTPWALLQLRGKTMKNGKPASKTTVSTSIDEMDPAEAKGMIRNAASQMLGRDPTKEEIEDFISKAQTIAKSNPNITTTTTQYGFDGEAVSQSSYSKGGGDAVTAQAQESAIEQSKQSEDYTAYQAAGVYMPWLMDALASPI